MRRLLQAGRTSIAVTSEFQSRNDDLEAAENALLTVPDEARFVIAHETDEAFEVGFASVAAFILAVLVVISLVGYTVAHQITKSVAALARAARQLGGGDLDAQDRIGPPRHPVRPGIQWAAQSGAVRTQDLGASLP